MYLRFVSFFAAPVSFSIKKPKEDPPKEIKSALPIEESDEDETENSATPNPPTSQSTNSSILTKFSESQQRRDIKEVVVNKIDNGTVSSKESSSNKETYTRKDAKITEASSKKNGLLDGDDPLLEIIELTGENGGDKKDSKRGIF